MSGQPVTSPAKLMLWASAGLLGAFGVAAFVVPGWATGEFPWTVGPLLAQTIGGWAIGTALIAGHAALVGRIERAYPLLAYLKVFGFAQLVVLVAFVDRLQAGHLLTYPYIGGLLALVAAWAAGLPAFVRRPDAFRVLRGRVPGWGRLLAVLVGGFVLLLAVGTLLAGPEGATARGEVFPEPMGLFSIRAFSAFLFAIAAAIWSLLLARSAVPYLHLGAAGLYLIVPITLAALLNLGAFDFAARPGGLLYILAYVVVGILLAAVLVHDRRNPAAFRTEAGPG